MAVSTFFLRAQVQAAAHFIVFKPGKTTDRLWEFFVAANLPKGTPYVPPILGEAQSGLTEKNISTVDYLPSFGGLPLFSSRFIERVGNFLEGEIEFFEATLICGGKRHPFWMGKILKRRRLVDIEGYGKDLAQHPFPPISIQQNIPDDFLVAREIESPYESVFIVSGAFKVLVESHRLKIAFTTT